MVHPRNCIEAVLHWMQPIIRSMLQVEAVLYVVGGTSTKMDATGGIICLLCASAAFWAADWIGNFSSAEQPQQHSPG